MSDFGNLLRGVSSVLWVLLAIAAAVTIYKYRDLVFRLLPNIRKIGVGPVSLELGERKLAEIAQQRHVGSGQRNEGSGDRSVGTVARRQVIRRLQRNSDLLDGCRILWVDDHPEFNTLLVELLQDFGAEIDLSKNNSDALDLMRGSNYEVVISDVGRDYEGENSGLKGIELAEEVFGSFGQRIILFTAAFNPGTLPGRSDTERLDLVEELRRTVFGIAYQVDEVLHLLLDVLERR